MIIFNTTYTVDNLIQYEWLYWMRTEYMPAIMKTGVLVSSRMLRLISDVGQQGVVVSVQLDFRDSADCDAFIAEQASLFYDRMRFRFGDKAVSFSTLLEEIWVDTVQ